MRLVSNSWWRRLWTLQEGVLAKNLAFQFHDGVVEVAEILNQFESSQTTFRMSSQLLKEAAQEVRLLSILKNKLPQDRVTDLLNTVSWRSTSQPPDEPLCLANILGLDKFTRLNNHSDGMKALFLRKGSFPSSFIFCYIGRMMDEGYGWAPSSFVFRSARDVSDVGQEGTEDMGSVSESGLDVKYPGFVFPSDAAPWRESETIVFRDTSDGSCFKVTPWRVRFSSIAISRYRDACLIFEKWPLQQELVSNLLSSQKSESMASLGSILADTGISRNR